MADSLRPRASVSKRQSILPQLPLAPTSIDPSAVIAKSVILTGNHPITIAAGVILHPYCKILSKQGPVQIGEGSIIWEKAVVGADVEAEDEWPIVLGRNVVVESGAVVEAAAIGDGSVVEAKVRVGRGARIGKHCKLVPFARLDAEDHLPDYTVLLQSDQRRLDHTMQSSAEVRALRAKGHEQHLEVLRRLIPNNIAKFQ